MNPRVAIVAVFMLAVAPAAVAAEGGAAAAVDGWDALLAKHVEPGGWVDYAGVATDADTLDAYLSYLAAIDAEAFAGRPASHRLATLINAYNAFTLRLILDHWDGGELGSIMDIPPDKRWEHQRWRVAGRSVSLNQLEHAWIRVDFDEPRIHWALVCAAYSCPPLRREAYTGDRLDAQLADQEAYVLNLDHPRFAELDGGTLRVTRLFEWYGQDFGDWRDYLRERLPAARQASSIGFLDYDWSLNDVRNRP